MGILKGPTALLILKFDHHHHRISRLAHVWPWGTPGGVRFASTSRIRSVFVIIALLT